MRKSLLIFLISFAIAEVSAQTWKTTYGPYSVENNTALFQAALVPRIHKLDSNEFLILGTANITSYDQKVQLIQTDGNGTFIKRDTLFNNLNTYGVDIVKLDSTYLVLGLTWDYGNFRSDMTLLEVDQNLDTIRTRSDYEFFNLGESGTSLLKESDSTLILIGATFSGVFPFLNTHTLIAKLNFNGDTVWTTTLPNDAALTSVSKTNDGNFIAVGSGNGGISNNKNIIITKFTTNGQVLWSKEYNYSQEDIAIDVKQKPDSTYVILGTTYKSGGLSNEVFFFSVDGIGDSLNFTTVGTDQKDYGIFLQENLEGNYLVVWGNSDTNSTVFAINNPQYAYVSMFSPSGDSLYTGYLTDSGSWVTSYYYNELDSSLFLCGLDSAENLMLIREDTLPRLTLAPDSVFPGDANNDGIANMLDFLTIGQHFGNQGFSRANSSMLWVGQPSINWFDSLVNGQNMKHADCDGNGIISFSDTISIFSNYALTHNKNSHFSNGIQSVDPPITLEAITDTTNTGDDAGVTVKIGDLTNDVDIAYGLSLTLNYDPTLVKDSSFGIDLSNSWLGTINVDMMAAVKYGQGQVNIGLTRVDLQNVSGHGDMFDLYFQLQDQLPNGDSAAVVVFDLVDLNLKTVEDTNVTVFQDSSAWDSINVKHTPIVVGQNLNDNWIIKLWPNPAKDHLNIFCNSRSKQIIRILDMQGRTVSTTILTQNKRTIDISNLNNGLYVINIEDKNIVIHSSKFAKY
jgi:hypothetical protein